MPIRAVNPPVRTGPDEERFHKFGVDATRILIEYRSNSGHFILKMAGRETIVESFSEMLLAIQDFARRRFGVEYVPLPVKVLESVPFEGLRDALAAEGIVKKEG